MKAVGTGGTNYSGKGRKGLGLGREGKVQEGRCGYMEKEGPSYSAITYSVTQLVLLIHSWC